MGISGRAGPRPPPRLWRTRSSWHIQRRYPTATLVKRMAAKLLDLDFEIKDLDKTIAERLRDYPYARIIESLPQFGPNRGLCSWSSSGVSWRRSRQLDGRHPMREVFLCQPDSGRVCGKLRRPKRFNGRLRRGVLSGRVVEPAHRRTVSTVL